MSENPDLDNKSNKIQEVPHSEDSQSTKSMKSPSKITNRYKNMIVSAWKRYIGLVNKELRVLVNDKFAMLIMYAIPLIVILILTLGVEQDILGSSKGAQSLTKGEIPNIGLIDLDTSEGFPDRDLSNELVQKFIAQRDAGQCNLIISTNQSELELMLGHGELNSFIIIPNLFEFNLSIHIPVIISVVFDFIDTMRLQSSQTIVDNVITEFREENGFTGVFQAEEHNVNLPEKSQLFFAAAPFLVPLLLFAIGSLTSTQAIVADVPKDRMVLTPTNKKEMLAAKVTANSILMLGLSLMIMIASVAASLQIRGSWFAFFLVMLFLSVNGVVIGVAISSFSQTPLSAFQYFIFVLLFQTIALFFIQDENITKWLPIEFGYELTILVVLRGQSFWSVKDILFTLFAETIIIYGLTYFAFKNQKNLL